MEPSRWTDLHPDYHTIVHPPSSFYQFKYDHDRQSWVAREGYWGQLKYFYSVNNREPKWRTK